MKKIVAAWIEQILEFPTKLEYLVLIILIWDWVRPLWVLKKCIC